VGNFPSPSRRKGLPKNWRTRLQPIRTASEIQIKIIIEQLQRTYLYQKYTQKATELRLLGISFNQIAKILNITKRTAINACKSLAKSLRGVPPQAGDEAI